MSQTSQKISKAARQTGQTRRAPFRLLTNLGPTVLAITTVVFFLLSLTLPALTTVSARAYTVAAWAAAKLTSAPDLLQQETLRADVLVAQKDAALVTEREATTTAQRLARKTATDLETAVVRAVNAEKTVTGLKDRVATLETELATNTQALLASQTEQRRLSRAVADASAKVAGQLTDMLTADVMAMPDQVGTFGSAAAVASSVENDAVQSCAMMKDLRDLAAATTPSRVIDVSAVCEMCLPAMAEVNTAAKRGGKAVPIWLGDTIVFWQ